MEKSARTPDPLNNSENNIKNKSEGKFRNIPFLKIAWPILALTFFCIVFMGNFICGIARFGKIYYRSTIV